MLKNVVSGFTESLAECPWWLRPTSSAPCENVSLWFINGALCRAHLSLHWVPDAIIKEMFLWMGLWQMNVSLQWQRKELSLLTRTDLGWYTSQWWPWLALPCLIFLRYTERHHTHGHAQTHNFILYPWSVWSSGLSAVVETGGEVCDKRNQGGRHPCPLWFPFSALIYSNTRNQLHTTWKVVQVW